MTQRLLALLSLGLFTFVLAASRPAAKAARVPSTLSGLAVTNYVWEPIPLPDSVATADLNSLAVSPVDAYTVFLGTRTGLYKSVNAGQTWIRVGSETLGPIYDLAVAPSNAQRLYAISDLPYRSDNDGGSWTLLASPPSACGLTVAPSNPDRVYVRTCNNHQNYPAVLRSDNAGQTWLTPTVAFTENVYSLVVSPLQPDIVMAGTFVQMFRSGDGGATWALVPVGLCCFPRPIFDTQSPNTVYAGGYTDLLRSQDQGQTWADSEVEHSFAIEVLSPFATGEVLGGGEPQFSSNVLGTWRLLSTGGTWAVQPWAAPTAVQGLWRSEQDGRVIYARNSTGLWRYLAHTVATPYAIFLPTVQRAESNNFPASAQQALERANTYRAQVGAAPLRLHAALIAAAQNHANYYRLNSSDPSAWIYGPHGEVPGKPGFTGQGPADRGKAAGFPWVDIGDDMHYLGNPVASVDGWMATIYHRIPLLDPSIHYTGYGNDQNRQTLVDVMAFGAGPTPAGFWQALHSYPQAYPFDGQTGVPTTWNGSESPDPLPPGAPRPVGYPFTLQGGVQISSATLRDASQAVVPVYPNPADCAGYGCYALIPVSPLQPNSTYTVQASGTYGIVPFSHIWTFTTGANSNTLSQPETRAPQTPSVWQLNFLGNSPVTLLEQWAGTPSAADSALRVTFAQR